MNGRPKYVHKACDASLQWLKVDYIDLYCQHRAGPGVPVLGESELVASGKVRLLGIPRRHRPGCAATSGRSGRQGSPAAADAAQCRRHAV